VQALGATHHRRHALHGDTHDVVLRLLCSERAATDLRVEAQQLAGFLLRAVALGHQLVPDAARRPELGDLFEEVVVRVPEEAEPRRERIDIEAGRDGGIDVRDAVGDGERDLLHRRAAGFADVVAADADGVPLRHVRCAVLEDVGDDSHAGLRRVDVRAAGDVLLEQVVLDGAADRSGRHALLFGHQLVHQQQDRAGGVDGHAGAHLVERQVGQQLAHVGHARDGHADFADLALGTRVVAVVAHLRGQVERTAQPGLAGFEQELEPLVGAGGGAEAGVLPHRPQLAAVHRGVHATGVGRLAGRTELGRGVPARQIGGVVQGLHFDARVGVDARVGSLVVAHRWPA